MINYNHAILEDARNCLDEQTRMVFDLGMAWVDAFTSIKETGTLSFENIQSLSQATISAICAGLQMASQFAQAQAQIEIAAVNKKYDAEINAAEGNSYKTKKLEQEKEKRVAKIKAEASKKEFTAKVFQAIGQTAMNAISAYGSLAGIPVVGPALGAAAAAAATALGMAQVALLKKQQQASEAIGYAEGGFTKPGSKFEPAGIVHAGEWVASQKLLASPVARPLIEALDYAQRTNTLGSLKSEDVSRAITAPIAIAQMTENSPSSAILAAAVMQTSSVVKKLTDRLNEPFVTVNTVAGDYGINHALEQHRLLMKNKIPKSGK